VTVLYQFPPDYFGMLGDAKDMKLFKTGPAKIRQGRFPVIVKGRFNLVPVFGHHLTGYPGTEKYVTVGSDAFGRAIGDVFNQNGHCQFPVLL
jgi:hypothetical protein